MIITVQMTEKIAEMAKIDLKGDELLKAREELCKMAGFAKEISVVADSINIPREAPENTERDRNRAACEMDISSLSQCGMHIKDGFFRIEAGARK